MKKAEERKVEQEIVYDRRLLKERQKEDHLYGGKEKFVTNAFKRKQMEQQKWLEERDKQDAKDKDVVHDKNFRFNFYSSIYDNRNVSMGAEKKEDEEEKTKEQIRVWISNLFVVL